MHPKAHRSEDGGQ